MAVKLLCQDQHIYDRFHVIDINNPNVVPDAALIILFNYLNYNVYVLSFKTNDIKHVTMFGPNPTGEVYDTPIYTGAMVDDGLRTKVLQEFEYSL